MKGGCHVRDTPGGTIERGRSLLGAGRRFRLALGHWRARCRGRARLPDGSSRLGIDAVRRRVEPRLHLVPRFRQVLYRPSWGLGWPVWVDAQSFNIADHVRVFPLPAPAGESELLAACERLRRQRLDPARPLWQLWLLPGLPQQRVGLFLRMHHAIADGVAGVAALGALLDLAADAPSPAAPPWRPAPKPAAGELSATTCGGAGKASSAPWDIWPTRPGRCTSGERTGQPGVRSSPKNRRRGPA
jgi:Wax ester synthase-like Acyl-CoA acyltransferase domain